VELFTCLAIDQAPVCPILKFRRPIITTVSNIKFHENQFPAKYFLEVEKKKNTAKLTAAFRSLFANVTK
jgi:hypothetical protein